MIASFANFLVRRQQIKLANLFLTILSHLSGNKNKINYNPAGFWSHKNEHIIVNDVLPNFRLNPRKLLNQVKEIYLFDYVPKAGDICIDIGAGIGLETIFLAKQIGCEGKVYAIEAAPFTFKVLNENITSNDLCHSIFAHNLAITDKEGKVRIGNNLTSHINNSTLGNTGDIVNSTTMDAFIENNKIENIDFLKVNIEGAEKLLIQKFGSISKVKNLAISCHDFLGKRNGDTNLYTKDQVCSFLKKNGFHIVNRNTGIDYIDDWIFGNRIT